MFLPILPYGDEVGQEVAEHRHEDAVRTTLQDKHVGVA
jgi:hypothetical protein